MKRPILLALLLVTAFSCNLFAASTINIGLNYPKTGAYRDQGLAQIRGALLAAEEINAQGGILGRPINLVTKNSASQVDRAINNVRSLATRDKVKMVFGGSSSAVAIAAGKEAKRHNLIYFGTLTYSNATTGSEGHRHMFRESYNAWMAAKVLSKYLNDNHRNDRFFYITADYTWGWSTESSMRKFTNTQNPKIHPGVKTKFPRPPARTLRESLVAAEQSGADVLVLVQFGSDMSLALQIANKMGLKEKMQIVVPSLTLGMAKEAGPTAMQGVVGAIPWSWQIPQQHDSNRGMEFVNSFAEKYQTYPSSAAASAYSILYQYKDAVERARSFSTDKIIKQLEGHRYSLLKDQQQWRQFDHQNIQTVYAVKGKLRQEVIKDRFNEDFFEIIDTLPGDQAARTLEEWQAARKSANKPEQLL
ncbi:MAG: ABC transporter substrate-binding protein [Candidatus Pelagadaptatus aseana]|uniref:ABC transporter substrate-binding protein n=1 Tax=Candidatus Pelagadaptatus aseana TaxID=3120508 RepID=UPI0039B340C2